jgi:diguanylate cyclase (GGDEF)-like protein
MKPANNNLIQFLGTIEIFSNLSTDELLVLSEQIKERSIDPGEVLFYEGNTGDELYIVREGEIAVTVKLPTGEDFEISTVTQGNFFGEMSIFEHAPRSATCYAKKKCRLLSLKGNVFYTLINAYPELAIKIMYRMLNITTERLSSSSNFLSDMVHWGEEARKRAVTDGFTGLFNRRFLDNAIKDQFSIAKRKKQNLSMAMVDLDHFGTLNEEYGEKTGDEILLRAVAVFKNIFRETDLLIRYGGDEFTFILPNTSVGEALDLCTNVCAQLRDVTILKQKNGTITEITSSIGIAAFPEHAASAAELIDKADKALYAAKEQGRNRAIVFQE